MQQEKILKIKKFIIYYINNFFIEETSILNYLKHHKKGR